MQIKANCRSAFTLVEIMVVVAIIGLLASIALPSWYRSRENAQYNSIGNNLRLLEGAKAQWALENKKTASETVTTVELTGYLKNNIMPQTVVGEIYVASTVGSLVTADTTAVLIGKTGPFTITNF
jgi:prepilin-type N-terminal cleavage/methylation domain-containing protein